MLRLVTTEGGRLAAIGLAIGLAGWRAVTRLIVKLLFGVKPADPLTFAAVAVILASLTLTACFTPACRATRVGPIVALRYE